MNDLIPISKFRSEVTLYDTEALLQMCSHLSRRLDDMKQPVLMNNIPGKMGNYLLQQNIATSQHGIALVAMLTLRQYRWSKGQKPEFMDVVRLVNNVDHIKDPFFQEGNILMTLIRMAHTQWQFQQNMHYFIPRHILIYLETNVPSPRIDPIGSFARKNGLTIQDFVIIGTCMYAAGLQYHTFNRGFIENTKVELLQPYTSHEKISLFLSLAGADYETFRQLCLAEEKEYPEAGPYQFNPLLSRPVIIRKDSKLCLPVPRLAISRVTKGLYYDLLDHFSISGQGANPFAEWFGHAFQEYGGMLLRDCFGEKNVFPEPRYGSPERSGPDWIVIHNDIVLFLEFRSGRLNKRAKTYANYEETLSLLKRNIVDTARKLPKKIEDLLSGRAGLPSINGKRHLSAIVTYESLDPHEYMLRLIKQELDTGGTSSIDFELMSIEDLEWLLAWAPHGHPLELLSKKRSDPATKDKELQDFVKEEAWKIGIKDLQNPLLERTWSKYMGEILTHSPDNVNQANNG
jgi:hypothetical protein